MQKFLIYLLAILAFAAAVPVNKSLLRTVISKGSANIIVRMSDGTDEILTQLSQLQFSDRGSRLNKVTNSLKSHAAQSQRLILDILSEFPDIKYESLWITNEIYISNADSVIIEKLSTAEGIAEIHEEHVVHLDSVQFEEEMTPSAVEPNIAIIQADRVWEELGITGEGAVVASIDTGVRVTHEALRDNFLGEYGWFDPSHGTPAPVDTVGQGTFSVGIIAGKFGIGVAPGAKWMSCRGCPSNSCTQSDLTRCAQFITCPTLPDGTAPKCDKAPHVVNNAWGGGRGTTWFDPSLTAMKIAGVVPVFTVGNSGPSCGTISSPGDSTVGVISVGSTLMDDTLASFSSRGPAVNGLLRPDITAPGVARSASHSSDTGYVQASGMPAVTHVSGTVGLLKSNTANLSYDQARKFLLENTDRNTPSTGSNCGGLNESVYPNHAVGYGRVNAYKAVKAFQDAN